MNSVSATCIYKEGHWTLLRPGTENELSSCSEVSILISEVIKKL
jgi:hypothetical protein